MAPVSGSLVQKGRTARLSGGVGIRRIQKAVPGHWVAGAGGMAGARGLPQAFPPQSQPSQSGGPSLRDASHPLIQPTLSSKAHPGLLIRTLTNVDCGWERRKLSRGLWSGAFSLNCHFHPAERLQLSCVQELQQAASPPCCRTRHTLPKCPSIRQPPLSPAVTIQHSILSTRQSCRVGFFPANGI